MATQRTRTEGREGEELPASRSSEDDVPYVYRVEDEDLSELQAEEVEVWPDDDEVATLKIVPYQQGFSCMSFPRTASVGSNPWCERVWRCKFSVLPDQILAGLSLTVLRFDSCFFEILPTSLGELPNLEELYIWECGAIEFLPDSIGNLKSLQILLFYGCKSLKTLPASLGRLGELRELSIVACTCLQRIPDALFNGLAKLEKLIIDDCKEFNALPESIGNLSNLHTLWLGVSEEMKHDCYGGLQLSSLPNSIGNLKSLRNLSLCSCLELKSLPTTIGGLQNLLELRLFRIDSVPSLPSSIGSLTTLRTLQVEFCKNIVEIPPELGRLSSLERLSIKFSEIEALPGTIGQLETLFELEIEECSKLSSLPAKVGSLKNLKKLSLASCENLTELPQTFGELSNLRFLCIQRCGIETLPTTIGQLEHLFELTIAYCPKLACLPAQIGSLKNLATLHLEHCRDVTELPPELGDLWCLKSVWLVNCGIGDWEKIISATLPPRLRVFNKGMCPYLQDDAPMPLETLSRFLTKNAYVKDLGHPVKSEVLQWMLTFNHFRRILPGGEVSVQQTEFSTMLANINEVLSGKRLRNLSILYSVLRTQNGWL